ncbi:MAG: hypothetical protein HY889_00450 [Deltaproteobacteria bacterium]|nr:hypothetical protein [Deltaproteobacteria bacterium]
MCTEKDKAARNCLNRLGLSDASRAVGVYTDGTVEELQRKGAQKVLGLGNLRLYECPVSYLSEETAELMKVVFLIDSTGQLLFEGAWADQPFWLVEAYEIYGTEKGKFTDARD